MDYRLWEGLDVALDKYDAAMRQPLGSAPILGTMLDIVHAARAVATAARAVLDAHDAEELLASEEVRAEAPKP